MGQQGARDVLDAGEVQTTIMGELSQAREVRPEVVNEIEELRSNQSFLT